MDSHAGVLRLPFAKYHGLGNDFVLVDGASGFITPAGARRLCDRRRGVGADGVLTLLPSRTPGAKIRMHVYNPDGSVAEMCGNGLRCVVRYVLAGSERDRVVIDTDGGNLEGVLLDDGRVRVRLGRAVMIAPRVWAPVEDLVFKATAVSMGNPHLVLDAFPPAADLGALAERYGARLERHPDFPARVNVGFMSASGADLDLVVFERGAGITRACGTGAAAAAVSARLSGVVPPEGKVRVRLPGGSLDVEVEPPRDPGLSAGADLGEVAICGEAVPVFVGEIDLEDGEVAGFSSSAGGQGDP